MRFMSQEEQAKVPRHMRGGLPEDGDQGFFLTDVMQPGEQPIEEENDEDQEQPKTAE